MFNAGVSNNGRIAGITDNGDTTKSVSYTYDEVNRLKTAETNGTHWGLTWTYDRYGNRTGQAASKGAPPTNSLSVDTATNRVTGWTYDAAGNVTDDGRNTYAYDAENRVISINGGATTYSYDAFGGRIQKVTGGTTVRYYFGLAENTNGAWTKLFISTPAGVIEWDNGMMIYRSNDHLGSPRVMTGASGLLVGRTDLYPYGEVWSESGSGTKYKMTGKERDAESGNDFFGARYYFNGTGRWLGVDPVLGNLYDPQRMNRYSYALDDPINYTDADGAEPIFRTHVIGYLPSLPVSPNQPTGGNRARLWEAGTPEHLPSPGDRFANYLERSKYRAERMMSTEKCAGFLDSLFAFAKNNILSANLASANRSATVDIIKSANYVLQRKGLITANGLDVTAYFEANPGVLAFIEHGSGTVYLRHDMSEADLARTMIHESLHSIVDTPDGLVGMGLTDFELAQAAGVFQEGMSSGQASEAFHKELSEKCR